MDNKLTSVMINFIDEEILKKGSAFSPLWIGLAYADLKRPEVFIEIVDQSLSIELQTCRIFLKPGFNKQ